MSIHTRLTAAPLFRTILFLIAFLAAFLILVDSPEQVVLLWVIPVYTLLWAVAFFAILAVGGLYGVWHLHTLRNDTASGNDKAKYKARVKEESATLFWRTYHPAVLGFGLGLLAFLYRPQVEGLVAQYLIFRTWQQMLLAALLALGVIMGFLIVRNWSEDQNEFMNSLKAIFGGAVVSALLGQLPNFTLPEAFAHYALGFAVSGSINLILYNKLIRKYAVQKDMETRATIDLLYGSDKAAVIDTYFQKRFEEDPSYARAKLVEALREYRLKVMVEYARKMSPEQCPPTSPGKLNRLANMRVYLLLAIECDEEAKPPSSQSIISSPPLTSPPVTSPPLTSPSTDGGEASSDTEEKLTIKFREVDTFTPEMFRMGITIRQGDNLVYITAPGEYRKPFPYYGSVAGLALLVRQTIVMNRDIDKKFRTDTYKTGLCPRNIEQARGLDEIDYLSYVSVPVASNLSNPEEVGLGILNVDTKLFAVPESEESQLEVIERLEEKVFRARTSKRNLNRWGTLLYGQEGDKVDAVKYLEEMRGVIVPILELYLRGLPGV